MDATDTTTPIGTLLIIAGALLVFGLIMLGSATAPIGQERFGSTYYFLWRQMVFGAIPGLAFFFFLRRISAGWWERSASICQWITYGLLGLVFIPGLGVRINGSLSWIHVGSISFQPAELAKVTFIIFLSWWLVKYRSTLGGTFTEGSGRYLAHVGAVCGLLILQPDVGTAMIFFATAMILFFIGGGRVSHVWLVGATGVLVVALLIALAPYRLQRITVLFDANANPLGSGYHLKQSLVALGSGGVLGLGIGNSRQKFQYLPEVSADSIFAVIGEELGFIISALLVLAYGAFLLKGFAVAKSATTAWARLFIVGTISWIVVQAMSNMGAMVGLIPLTGLPLPLISHGGSSLMITLASLGIVSGIMLAPHAPRRV